MEIVANGKKYSLDPGAYEVIGELNRENRVCGINRRGILIVHQLCKVRDEMRFFILTMQDYSTYIREKVQVWPVSVDEAKKYAEDLVFADRYEEIFGKVEG